jgi:hypothetical protein
LGASKNDGSQPTTVLTEEQNDGSQPTTVLGVAAIQEPASQDKVDFSVTNEVILTEEIEERI